MIINQPPPELFAERPVRSVMEENGGGLSYRVRRIITLSVLVFVVSGTAYWLLGRSSDVNVSVTDVPVIKADPAPYKQRPEQPGGMAIPHQDVEVYAELEGKSTTGAKGGDEKLLPASETPLPEQIAQQGTADFSTLSSTPFTKIEALQAADAGTAPHGAQETAAMEASASPNAELPPPPATQEHSMELEDIARATPPASVKTTLDSSSPSVAPKGAQDNPAPRNPPIPEYADQNVSQKTPPFKQEKVPTENFASTLAKVSASAKTESVVQLASIPNQNQAQLLLGQLQQRHAGLFKGTSLRLVRADLGAKGIYYRIQTAPVAANDAKTICSALKQQHAGCIIVRP